MTLDEARRPLHFHSVEWLLTGVIIACSLGILAFTGYLLYRLFGSDQP